VPRWFVAVVDQGLVAILNLALSVTVTQVAGVTTLGRFAIVTTTTTLCMGVARLLVTDPWLASRTASTAPGSELRWLVATAAVGAAVVTAVVVMIISGGDQRWLLAVPIAAAVVVQDFGRYLSFRVERTTGAFASDLGVLVGATVTFGVAALLGKVGLAAVLLAWLVGLVVGIAVLAGRMAGPMRPRGAYAWWGSHCRFLATRLAFDTVAYMVGVSGSLYLLAYVGTERDVGLVRIVQTLFSPAALIVTGLTMWLVPFLANRSAAQADRVSVRATVWLVAGTLPLVVLAVLVGPWFASLVFGVDDGPSYAALVLAGVSTMAMALAAPWVAGARVSGHYLPIAWSRAGAAVATIVGMVTVPALRSTTGYLGLLAFQNVTVATTAITIGVRKSENESEQPAVTG
jgi:O-antigen/teichoic acid export membrane protein